MNIQDFIKKNIVSLLAISVSTTSVALSVAVPGATGSTGSIGPIGSLGSVGPSGPQGPAGSSGATGSQGPVGPSGPAGETGSSGIPGQTPFIGSNGNWWIGVTDTGVKADVVQGGSSGATGPQGPVGPTGSSGATGSQGPVGPAGENGLTPYIGPNGNWWTGNVDSGITTSTGGFSEENIPFYPITMTASETLLSNRVNKFAEFSLTLTQSEYVQLRVSEGFTAISTAAQLFSITDKDGRYVLTGNIDVSISTLESWSPLEFNGEPFSGEFDGAGFEIQNLKDDNLDITDPDELDGLGLFEVIRDASISNITFKNVDINFYDLPIVPFFANNLGSLAGMIDNSTLENINLDTVSLIGRHSIGGIAGSVSETTLHISDANNVILKGQSNVGGAFGETFASSLNQLDYDHVDILFDSSDQPNYSGHDSFGGVTGSSFVSNYLNIDIDVNINNIGLIPIDVFSDWGFSVTEITNIGGLMGESDYDRLFSVFTTGSITFTPNQEEFYLADVGGVSGSAFNTSYFEVVNTIDISLAMGDLVETMYFVSIGGVIGVASFVNLERVYNFGNVEVLRPTLGIDLCIYFSFDQFFGLGGCETEPTGDYPIEYFGGIIGYIEGSAYLTYSANLGDIFGIVEVGGLVGSSGGGGGGPFPFFIQYDLIIQQSFNEGIVDGLGFVGGIMGLSDERTNLIIANAYNVGDVAAELGVGGILGIASPGIGVEILIVNTYNAGDIFVWDVLAGGLIGGTFPTIFFDFNPNDGPPNFDLLPFIFGSVEIHNSFHVGEINGDPDSFFASASVIGLRFIQTRMYGVSYLQQFFIDEFDVLPSTTFLPGVAEGNNVDMKAIALEDSFLYFDDARFIYRSAWNFTNVWEWIEGNNLPTLRNIFLD
jgi:hypothetical protein